MSWFASPLVYDRGPRREHGARRGVLLRIRLRQLDVVARDYDERYGVFSDLTTEATSRLVASWGEDAYRIDDPLMDEVRAIRRNLAEKT